MRKYTNMVLDMMDEGVIDPKAVAEMCLAYMSEAEVEDMCRDNDLLPEEDEYDFDREAGEDFADGTMVSPTKLKSGTTLTLIAKGFLVDGLTKKAV